MFNIAVLLSFLSAANGAPGYHHGGMVPGEGAIPFIAGRHTSDNGKKLDVSDKTLVYHDEEKHKTLPVAAGHATSYSNRVDATGKPIYQDGIGINEQFEVPFATGVSSYSSREKASSKSVNCISVVPLLAKSFVPSDESKAIVTPIVAKTVLIPAGSYVAHSIPLLSSYGLKLAYEAGLGYGHGYGYGNGYGYLHGHPYVQVHGHPYIYGR